MLDAQGVEALGYTSLEPRRTLLENLNMALYPTHPRVVRATIALGRVLVGFIAPGGEVNGGAALGASLLEGSGTTEASGIKAAPIPLEKDITEATVGVRTHAHTHGTRMACYLCVRVYFYIGFFCWFCLLAVPTRFDLFV